jgi:biofilm PGA synthesis N-glycosyltransferase PgaC
MIYLAIACFALLFYSYVGYPVLVSLLATTRPKRWTIDETYRPTVSIIVPAFNEEAVLRRCLSSLLQINYPHEKVEILCGSDGSTDATNAIISEFAAQDGRFRPMLFSTQRGKMQILNDLTAAAKNDILLFIDADVTLNPNGLLYHVRHYADRSVGGVAGRLTIAGEKKDGTFKSESIFLTTENNLRRNEALISSTVGLYGGNYSIRRGLWHPLPEGPVYDDFFSVLTIISSGLRLVYEEDAVSVELYARTLKDEFARKTRNAARCMYTLRYFPSTLLSKRAAWSLWPHKILRWTTGYWALLGVAATLIAYQNGVTGIYPFLMVEAIVAILIFIGFLAARTKVSVIGATQLYWFFNMNLAFMKGVLQAFVKRQPIIWSQTTRYVEPIDQTFAGEVVRREA